MGTMGTISDEVFVKIIKMPYTIHAFTRPNLDGTFCVFLNSYDCHERQEEAKRHELLHIERGDYDRCGVCVDLIELSTR
jgi:hypothetical protein